MIRSVYGISNVCIKTSKLCYIRSVSLISLTCLDCLRLTTNKNIYVFQVVVISYTKNAIRCKKNK